MNYVFQFNVVWNNLELLLSGVWVTLLLTAGSLTLGMMLGLVLGVLRLSKRKWISIPVWAYIEVFRNTPALVQLIWIYYCLPILTGLEMGALVSCMLALGLYGAAYTAEIFRAGIQSIDRGQIEAAATIGLSPFHTLRRIILPQAIRRMIPPLVNESITLLKFSSLVSILGVADLTYQAQVLATTTFRPIEIFTFIAVVYFILCSILAYLSRLLERRLAGWDR